MLLETQSLWVKSSIYIYLLCSLYVYTRLSQLKYQGINLIKTRDSILISAFFPVFIILLLVLGSFLFLALSSNPLKTKIYRVFKKAELS